MAADDLAYVIFTSGTTGVPKGVKVATASVAAYLAALGLRKAMTAGGSSLAVHGAQFRSVAGRDLPALERRRFDSCRAGVEPGLAGQIHPRPTPNDLGLHALGDCMDARYAHAPAGIAAGTSLHVVRRRAPPACVGACLAGRRAEQRHRQPLRSDGGDRRLRRPACRAKGNPDRHIVARSAGDRRPPSRHRAPRARAGPPSGPGLASPESSPSAAVRSTVGYLDAPRVDGAALSRDRRQALVSHGRHRNA